MNRSLNRMNREQKAFKLIRFNYIMWFIKKKDDNHKWRKLHHTLTKSFNNIKQDVSHIHKKIDTHHYSNKDEVKILTNRVKRLEILYEQLVLDYSKNKKEQQLKTYTIGNSSEKENQDQISSLTNLQKSIIVNLYLLSTESSHEWVSMREISQELYPDKKYSKIKSLLSAYTDLLVDLNLIKKERKGRETYLSLTSKAQVIVQKTKIKKTTKNNT